jgi:hypothetical protein
MGTEQVEAENRTIDMILIELKNAREDRKENDQILREDIKALGLVVQLSNRNCSLRSADCSKQFVTLTTFWKVMGVMILLVFGGYAYTGVMLQYFMKHIAPLVPM